MQYSQLKLSDREVIERMLVLSSQKQIAEALGVSESTISRELHRNSVAKQKGGRKYCSRQAHWRAQQRKQWSHQARKLTDQLKDQIADKIRAYWTPELISGWLRRTGQHGVSHEWIYQWIYRMYKSYKAIHRGFKDLFSYLPRAHRQRRKRSACYAPRCTIKGRQPLSNRPRSANRRSRAGHFEADLIIGKGRDNGLLVLTDRKLRWTAIRKWNNRKARNIAELILDFLKANPWVKTMTFDNDLSFAAHQTLGIKTFFTRPYQSQDKGTVEQRNQLIRTRYPKKTDFSSLDDKCILELQQWINNRPMKLHNFKTPQQALDEYLSRNPKLALQS